MKLAFYKTLRLFCPVFKYVLSVLLSLAVGLFMTCWTVPVMVSTYVSYLGFTEGAPTEAVLLMAGIPLLFASGLLLYGTIRFLSWSCRSIVEYFDLRRVELTRKIDLGGEMGKSRKRR